MRDKRLEELLLEATRNITLYGLAEIEITDKDSGITVWVKNKKGEKDD